MIRSHRAPLSRRRGVLPLLAAGLLIALTSGLALAHANLARSEPPAGASLSTSPDHVQLWFTEALEPSFSTAVVYDANRQRVDKGDSHVDLKDPASLIVSLDPKLPDGSYAIAWKSQSLVDGHVVNGAVPFQVGMAAPAASSSLPPGLSIGTVSGSPLEMTLRWLSLLSTIALVGSFAFWLLQRRSAGLPEGSSHPGAIQPAQLWVASIAWMVFVASNSALLIVQSSIASDLPLPEVLGRPLVQTLGATQYGYLWDLRMILGIMLGALLFYRQHAGETSERATPDGPALVLGACLLLGVTLASHSADMGSLTPLGIANDWLHLGAATVWVGGLLQLAVLLASLQITRTNHSTRAPFLGVLVSRFSLIATIALVALAVTGVMEALFHVGTLDHLLNTAYGQALLVKILLIVPLVAIAAVNHFLILPVLADVRVATGASALAHLRAVARTLGWMVRLEVVFAIGVLAATGVLVNLNPSQQVGTSASPGPLTLTAPVDDVVLALGVAPGRPGPNHYNVDVRDSAGKVVTDVERASVRFTYLDKDLGVSEVVLVPVDHGRFGGDSSDLAVVGQWQAEVLVRRVGRVDASTTVRFEVTPEGARALQSAQLQYSWLLYAGAVLVLIGCGAVARGFSLRARGRGGAIAVIVSGLILCMVGTRIATRDFQQAQARASTQDLARLYPITPQSIAAGAVVYRQSCLLCHGPGARGDGPLAQTLVPPPLDLITHAPLHTDADLVGWIADGVRGSSMPAFRNQLTEQQRWEALSYVKSLVTAPPLVTLAQSAGPTLVTLTVDPAGPGSNRLLATLQDASGGLVTDARLRVRAHSLQAVLTAGTMVDMVQVGGVYQASMKLAPAGRWQLDVFVSRPGQAESSAPFDLTLPVPGLASGSSPSALDVAGARQLLPLVDRTMNQLRSLVENNELTAGGPVVTTRYEFQSPDRTHYTVQTPDRTAETYVLGVKRYDRTGDGPWEATPFPGTQPYRWPQFNFSENATQVIIVDQEPVQNVDCAVLSFIDSSTGTRYRLWVGSQDHRVYKEAMMATGHYMISTFSGFDAPLTIESPMPQLGG